LDPPESARRGYREAVVKQAIVEETCDKCAYCETKVTHSQYGDVEHIRPKAVYPELLLDYDNLTLACRKCNGQKLDYDDPDEPLLNPYVDEPRDHLMSMGALVRHVFGDRRAETTVAVVGLNRPGLVERRDERIQKVGHFADKVAVQPEGPLRDYLETELEREVDNCSEYSFVVREFLRLGGWPFAAGAVEEA